jgi:hypothetical protein
MSVTVAGLGLGCVGGLPAVAMPNASTSAMIRRRFIWPHLKVELTN